MSDSQGLSRSSQAEARIVPWEDNWGDINWAVIDAQGRILSYHGTWLSARATVEMEGNLNG